MVNDFAFLFVNNAEAEVMRQTESSNTSHDMTAEAMQLSWYTRYTTYRTRRGETRKYLVCTCLFYS